MFVLFILFLPLVFEHLDVVLEYLFLALEHPLVVALHLLDLPRSTNRYLVKWSFS